MCSMSAADRFLYSGVSWATNAIPSNDDSRPCGPAAEDGDEACGRHRQADRKVQQGGLARAVRADERDHVSGGNRQRALAQRPAAADSIYPSHGLR